MEKRERGEETYQGLSFAVCVCVPVYNTSLSKRNRYTTTRFGGSEIPFNH